MNCPLCQHKNISLYCPTCGWKASKGSLLNQPSYPFINIAPQDFWMGSALSEQGRDHDENLHAVTITRPFQIGLTEVSQSVYQAITNENPSFFVAPDRPVENISWIDAVQFCNAYSHFSSLPLVYQFHNGEIFCDFTKTGFRLPTEAEWELVAKRYVTSENDHHSSRLETEPISTANKDVHNILNNVWEFCWDYYAPYPAEKQTDPTGPITGEYRIIRGGSWIDSERIRRAANRGFIAPDHHSETIGFRLARTLAHVTEIK